jgi:general secretion pathway protein A
VYTDFYKLKEKPFNLTPSSKFLFLGEVHKEALAILTYGVVERKGFVLLTGEVGAGKTTMVQALLGDLDKTFKYVHLSNPLLSPADFRDYLGFFILNKQVHFESKTGFLFAFENFLRKCNQNQENFTLIIDEAQKLSFELLEEIRLLSNMETADEKLINIFLVGQPELNEKLSGPRCRALLQRISIRHHITPMDFKGTRDYMATRLKMAGSRSGDEIFSGSAVKAIHQYSEGYPRMINVLSDNALILGYSRGKRKISHSMIKECYENLRLDRSISREVKTEKSPQTGSRWKWAAVLFLIIAFSTVIVSRYGKDIFFKFAPLPPASDQQTTAPVPKDQVAAVEKTDKNTDSVVTEDTAPDNVSKEQVLVKKNTDEPYQGAAIKVPAAPGEVSAGEIADEKTDKNQIISQKEPVEQTSQVYEKGREPWIIADAKNGDTLAAMAIRVYGRVDENIYKLIQKHNPEIEDINKISVGQRIVFPPLSPSEHGPTYTVHVISFRPVENALEMYKKLTKEGYEVFIIPAQDAQKGKTFKVTIGNFKSLGEAEDYAAEIIKKGLFDQAKAIQVDMR